MTPCSNRLSILSVLQDAVANANDGNDGVIPADVVEAPSCNQSRKRLRMQEHSDDVMAAKNVKLRTMSGVTTNSENLRTHTVLPKAKTSVMSLLSFIQARETETTMRLAELLPPKNVKTNSSLPLPCANILSAIQPHVKSKLAPFHEITEQFSSLVSTLSRPLDLLACGIGRNHPTFRAFSDQSLQVSCIGKHSLFCPC